MAGTFCSALGRQRERNAAVAQFIHSGMHGMVLPTVRVDLPTSLNSVQRAPPRHPKDLSPD